jgi:hypothetical protein
LLGERGSGFQPPCSPPVLPQSLLPSKNDL